MYKSEQSPQKKANGNPYSLQSGQKSTSSSISNCREIMIETNDKQIPFISIYKPDLKREQKGLHVIMNIFTVNCKVKTSYAFNRLLLLKKAEEHMKSKAVLLSQTLKSIIKKQKTHLFLRLCANKMKKRSIVDGLNIIIHLTTKWIGCNMKIAMHKLALNRYQVAIDSMQEKQLLLEISQLKQQRMSQEVIQKSKTLQRISNHQAYIESLRKSQFQTLLKTQQKRFELLRSKVTPKRKVLFDNQLFIVVVSNTIKAFQGQSARYEEQLKLACMQKTEDKDQGSLSEIIQAWSNEIKTMDRQVKNTPFNNPNKLITIFSNHSKQLKSKNAASPLKEMIESRLFLHELILKCLNLCVEQKQCQQANRQFAELVTISNEEHKLANFIHKIRQSNPIKTLAQTILMFHKKITEFEGDPHQEEPIKQYSKWEEQQQLLQDKYAYLQLKHAEMAILLAEEKIKNQKHHEECMSLQERYNALLTKHQENQAKMASITSYEINIKQVDEPTPLSISNRELCQKLNRICNKSSNQLKTGNNGHLMKSTDMMKQLLLIKMQAENQFMSYEKEISLLKRELIKSQNTIDQLQASIFHKDNQLKKHEQSFQAKQIIPNESISLSQPKWRQLVRQKEYLITSLIKQKQQMLIKQTEDDRDVKIKKLQQKVQQLNQGKRKFLQKQRQLQQSIRAWQEELSSIQNQLKQKTSIIDQLQKQLQLCQKDNKNLQDTGEKSISHTLRQKESKDSLSYSEDHQETIQIQGLIYNILLHSKGKMEKIAQQKLWQDLCEIRQNEASTFYTKLLQFSKQFITKCQQ